MKRIYETVLKEHFSHYQQMLFLAGPRQVGKTTVSLSAKDLAQDFLYLNWDNDDHRRLLLSGPTAVANLLNLQKMRTEKPIVVFDELHKYKRWKNFLKGFFDTYKNEVFIIITGSSKLDTYRKSSDSLMGRYFPYRVHPLSVAECLRSDIYDKEIAKPEPIRQEDYDALFQFGGFPEPFLNRNTRFSRRWKSLRSEQLFRQDIRDLTHIHEIQQLEVFAALLKHQAGQLVNYSNLANKTMVSVDTIRRWMKVLSNFYYCFTIKPWKKNVSRSLLKEPKVYLWDWSDVEDLGMKTENFIAAHLLKATHFWTDMGMGHYELYFLRDKDKREVDFLVTKDDNPWFLVEAKHGGNHHISSQLGYFQKKIGAAHAFEVILDREYVPQDCFLYTNPIQVPALTFLSQLV